MAQMQFIAARVRIDVLRRLDALIDQGIFENRSHAVRVALRELLAKQEGTRIAEPVVDRTSGHDNIGELLAEVKALQSK